jgi:hypothetical protein
VAAIERIRMAAGFHAQSSRRKQSEGYKGCLSKLIPAYKLTLVPFRMFAVRIVITHRGQSNTSAAFPILLGGICRVLAGQGSIEGHDKTWQDACDLCIAHRAR